jgi:hypothetical protein
MVSCHPQVWVDGYVHDIPEKIEVSAAFQDAVDKGELATISTRNALSMSPSRMLETIDHGMSPGIVDKEGVTQEALVTANMLHPTHKTKQLSNQFNIQFGSDWNVILDTHGMNSMGAKRYREFSGAAIEFIPAKNKLTVNELLGTPEIRKIVAPLSDRDKRRVVGFAKDARGMFDTLLELQNNARASRGQDLIPERQGYKPHVREINLLARYGLEDLSKAFGKSYDFLDTPDFIRPNAPFLPHTLQRSNDMKDYNKVQDLRQLMDDYIGAANKDIFYTDIIRNVRAHTNVLRKNPKYTETARNIDAWVSESYAGVLAPLDKLALEMTGNTLLPWSSRLRRGLVRSVFPANLPWTIFIQSSSIGNTIARYGPANLIKGLDYILDPKVKELTSKQAYSLGEKQIGGGSYVRSLLEEPGSLSAVHRRTPLNTVEDITNYFNTLLETSLHGVSVRAAYHDGLERGLKPESRELWEWASAGGEKTQSMYNVADRPALLRNQIVQSTVPFQSFAFEMFTMIRELVPLPSSWRAGAYRAVSSSNQQKMKQIMWWVASMIAINAVGEKYNNRSPYVLGSFLPFYNWVGSGLNPKSNYGGALQFSYATDLFKGVSNVFRGGPNDIGSWTKLRQVGLKYHVPAGGQVNRIWDGITALASGEVNSPAGNELYRISRTPGEMFKGVFFGPGGTEAGREYSDDMERRRRGKSEGEPSDFGDDIDDFFGHDLTKRFKPYPEVLEGLGWNSIPQRPTPRSQPVVGGGR